MSAPTRRLPAEPSLEQLRKQAKDLLTQYRDGDTAAAAEVAAFDWRATPDAFALNDAQRILARAYGFASWPKLKAFVDGANVRALSAAVTAGDQSQVRVLLNARPELIGMDQSGGDERRAIHFAVVRRDPAMTKLLMEAGSDARSGVYPHREATTALAIARDRGYDDIVDIIETEERHRREEMSCPNATVSPVQDRIVAAICDGDTAGAIALLDADKSLIQACDRNGATALHVAAYMGNTTLVEWLLQRRAPIHKEDLQGRTALDCVALSGDPDRVGAVSSLLLDAGAQLTIRAAVALGDGDRVRTLITANPDLLRELNGGEGLLTLAVKNNQLEVLRLLLDLGADPDERTILQELEEPTPSWGSPLWQAARDGNYPICELLLDRGADPNANVYASGWPLRNAWHHPDPSVKELLLRRGARVQPFMAAELHDATEARRLLEGEPAEAVVCELLEASADGGCPEIVEMALAHVDWPRADNKWRWYLIQPMRGIGSQLTSFDGHYRCMQLLLAHGIDPNVAAFGQTALHFISAWHGDVPDPVRARFAEILLDAGARFDLRDEILNSTPLAWACRWGRREIVDLLIARGAPVHEPDAEPWATPLAWAEKRNHTHIRDRLLMA